MKAQSTTTTIKTPTSAPSDLTGLVDNNGIDENLFPSSQAAASEPELEAAPIGKPRAEMSSNEKAALDKAALLTGVENFLATNTPPIFNSGQEAINLRRDAWDILVTKAVTAGSRAAATNDKEDFAEVKTHLSDAMKKLEGAREARTGIKLEILTPQDGSTPILVRDARNAKDPMVRGTESWSIQYLNVIRAGIDIALMEGRPEIVGNLLQKAQDFMSKDPFSRQDDLSSNIDERLKQEKYLNKALKNEIEGLAAFMEAGDKGIPNAFNKLSIGKDFQNFTVQHHNVATISTVGGTPVIEAEVALKGLTFDQKVEYAKAADPNEAERPDWCRALPWWQQQLVANYAATIAGGEHTIPTQLLQIPGLRNAFEKTTAVGGRDGLEVIHVSKHSGTIASIAQDPEARGRLTEQNFAQAQEWVGQDAKLHVNSFNSPGKVGVKSLEQSIIKELSAASDNGQTVTNAAFNFSRVFSASDLTGGVNNTLKNISDSLPDPKGLNKDAANAIKRIKAHLEPRPSGFLGEFRRFVGQLFKSPSNTVFSDVDESIKKLTDSGVIDENAAKILKSATDLRRAVDKSENTTNFTTAGNNSLNLSTQLNALAFSIANTGEIKGLEGLRKEQVLVMCASGKDRTALSEHDQTAQAVAKKLGLPLEEVDKAIIRSGHGAQQAGGVYSCGSAAGCNGTGPDNAYSIGNAIAAARRVKKGHEGRGGREEILADLIENASKGTLNKPILQEGGEDVTLGGHPKETEHQQVLRERRNPRRGEVENEQSFVHRFAPDHEPNTNATRSTQLGEEQKGMEQPIQQRRNSSAEQVTNATRSTQWEDEKDNVDFSKQAERQPILPPRRNFSEEEEKEGHFSKQFKQDEQQRLLPHHHDSSIER